MKKLSIINEANKSIEVDVIRYFQFKNDFYLIYTLGEKDEKNHQKLYLVKILEELGFPVVQIIKNNIEWSGMQNIVKKVIKEIKSDKRNLSQDIDCEKISGIKITNPRFFKLDENLTNILSSNYMDSVKDNSLVSDEKQILNNQIDIQENEPLEPIEQTIAKEGAFEPINEQENVNQTQPLKESIEDDSNHPVESDLNDQTINESIIEVDKAVSKEEIDNVNYKKLYLASKKENESTSAVLEDLLNKLQKYQDKYGDIE